MTRFNKYRWSRKPPLYIGYKAWKDRILVLILKLEARNNIARISILKLEVAISRKGAADIRFYWDAGSIEWKRLCISVADEYLKVLSHITG